MRESRWKTLRTKLIGTINMREVELPTGKRLDYLVVSYPEAVGVLALIDHQRVILVGQYRYAVDEYSKEIPMGARDSGESIEDCARRELEEETGYSAAHVEKVFTFHPSNAASNQVVHICVASELTQKTSAVEHHEPVEELIQVEIVPFDELLNMVLRDEIKDASTVIAVLLYSSRARQDH